MNKKMYRINGYSDKLVEEVTVSRKTKSNVWLLEDDGKEFKQPIKSEYGASYFDTEEDALNFLYIKHNRAILEAQEEINYSKEQLKKIANYTNE